MQDTPAPPQTKPLIPLSRLRELYQQARSYYANFEVDARALFRACVHDEIRLRTIAEQAAELQALRARIAELEREP